MSIDFNPSAAAPQKVTTALKRASEATGAGFDFLKMVAARESSLNPTAKAKTSSAAGLFQFIDQTWLGAVKQYGSRHGLGEQANDIKRGDDGRFNVSSPARREEILALRFDANASAALAGELANENQSILERKLGRGASSADLYTAHFLGPAGAVKLLSAASSVEAASLLPKAASANRAVFYDGARAKTVGEVVSSIASSMSGADVSADAKTEAPAAALSVSPTANMFGRQGSNVNYGSYAFRNILAMDAQTLEQLAQRQSQRPAEPAALQSVALQTEAAPMRAYTALASSSRLSTLALSALQGLDMMQVGEDRQDRESIAER
jgi:transglycosylase-like protein with SLT domain